MKTIIKILLLSILILSCSKEDIQATSNINLALMTPTLFDSKEHSEKVFNLEAVRAEFETDKGTFVFNDLEKQRYAYITNEIEIDNGVYQIIDIRLYNASSEMIFQVFHGKPTQDDKNGMVVSFVYDKKDGECNKPECNYDYVINKDKELIFQVWDM